MAVLKNNFLQAFRGKTYYYKVDTTNKTVSFYDAPTNASYKNDTGSLIFTEKIDKLKSTAAAGSSTTITNANTTLIKSYGRNFIKSVTKTALSNIENNRDPAISGALGITNPNDRTQVDKATGNNSTPEPDRSIEPTNNPPSASVDDQLRDVTEGQNRRNAQDIEITTTQLKKIGINGVLKYPIDLDTTIQDTLQIQVFQYQAARRLPNILSATDDDRELGGSRFLRTESLKSDGTSRKNRLLDAIILPIPNALADSNAVAWGGGEFSSIAGQLGTALTDAIFSGLGGDEAESLLESIQDAGNVLGGAALGTISGAKELIGNPYFQRKKILETLAKGAGALGVNVDVTQVITRVGGVVENPNLELLFTGPSLRSFTFQIRLTPRSIDESKVVRRIIRAFKQHSAVKKGARLGLEFDAANLLLGTPDVFVLKYIQAGTKKEIKGLTKMKTCALTNVSVDYTGGVGRWAAYDGDSQPMTNIVTLQFAELAPIYDVDYNQFDVEDVGY